MAVRGVWDSMRESSERMRGEKEGGGRGGREGCGVLVWVGGREEVMSEAMWARVWGVGGGSMSEGLGLARWVGLSGGEVERVSKGLGDLHGRESWDSVIRDIVGVGCVGFFECWSWRTDVLDGGMFWNSISR